MSYIQSGKSLVWLEEGAEIAVATTIPEYKSNRKCMRDIIQEIEGKQAIAKVSSIITGGK